jgi:DNA-binding NarL/FixJ family response regulator
MADVVAFIDDIFFQAKVVETARHLDVEFRACASTDALKAEIAKAKPKLVIVDLNARADAFGAISLLKAEANDVPMIAFLSHVQVELAEKARAAGCTDVMPRSKFTRDLATILGRAKSQL